MKIFKRVLAAAGATALLAAVVLLVFLLRKREAPYEAPAYTAPEVYENVPSSVVAENERFLLRFDKERICLFLEEKATGKIWGTVPYEFYQAGDTNVNVDSPIFIEYYDVNEASLHPLKAFSASIDASTVSSQLIENGLRINFFFDEAKIMIPVAYVLRDSGLVIEVDPAAIQEQSCRVTSISLAPFFCSARNEVEGGYLFIPSGSGALMYTKEYERGRTFSGEMYGLDPSKLVTENATNEMPLLLPVFGAKEGGTALCGIIESGAGMACLEATAGNSRNGYSNVYPTFYVRGCDTVEARVSWSTSDVQIFTDSITAGETIEVGYYPLIGEDANYIGMAKTYREYLQERGSLTKERKEDVGYGITLLGGAQITKHFLGIPYDSLKVTTNYVQAASLLEELKELTGGSPTVRMAGFAQTGLDAGKIAGGYRFERAFGSEKERKVLEVLAKVYWDFDLVFFKKSGSGYSTVFDTAQTANGQASSRFPFLKALHGADLEAKPDKLLSRALLTDAGEKLAEFAQIKNIQGVSLSTLGQTAYSDYAQIRYSGKSGVESQMQAIVEALEKHQVNMAVSCANGYAASLASVIFETPLCSGQYDGFDEDIPFYQMVFKGYVPLISSSINLAADREAQFLKAIESGASPGYTLSALYDTQLAGIDWYAFYGSLFSDNRDRLAAELQAARAYYDAINGAVITGHARLENGVTRTRFDNGVVVYTNQGGTTAVLKEGRLEAGQFLFVREGGE